MNLRGNEFINISINKDNKKELGKDKEADKKEIKDKDLYKNEKEK